MRCVQMVGADANLRHQANIRQTETHRRRREKHEQSQCQGEERVHMRTAFQPAVYANWHSLWPKCRPLQAEVEQRAESFEHGGEDLTDAYRSSCLQKRIRAMLQYRYGKAPVDGMLQHRYDKHIHMVPSVSPVIILKTCLPAIFSFEAQWVYKRQQF